MLKAINWLFYPAVSVTLIWYWLLKCNGILKKDWKITLPISVFHEVACALCAIAMSFVEAGFVIENATTYRLYGLMYFLPVFYLLLSIILKVKKSVIFDIFAVAIVIRLIIGRFDCILSGCCKGVFIPLLNGPRWPIREVEIGYYLTFIYYFSKKIINGKTYGQVYPIYLLSYGILRFCMEWLREEYVGEVGIFHSAHIWSLIAIAVGAVMLYIVRKNIQPGGKRRNEANSKNLAKGGK